ncbi:MAG: hypothetical protein SVW57_14560, partial [Thermodesulfobacteriota bacterium]|nr:hypothetical protein [Thermodesulfobacteriota bacterium]
MVSREVFWNIPSHWQVFVYVAFIILLITVGYGVCQCVKDWLTGTKDAELHPKVFLRLWRVLKYGVLQMKIHRYRKVMHLGMFFGFLGLFVG